MEPGHWNTMEGVAYQETRLRSKGMSGGRQSLESLRQGPLLPLPQCPLWLTVLLLDSFQCPEQLISDVLTISACFSQALGHYGVGTVHI